MRDTVRVAIGILGSVIAIGTLILIVGLEEFTQSLLNSNIEYALVSGVFALFWLMSWSGTFYTVASSIDLELSYPSCFRTYSTVMFANNVTPFAHLGGEPLAAGFISKVVDEDYEKCLGGLSAVSVMHFVPSVIFFIAGSAYFGINGQNLGTNLRLMLGAFLVLTLLIVLAGVSVYAYRSRTQDIIISILVPIFRVVGKIPRLPSYGPDRIRKLVEGYLSSFLEVANDRRTVAIAVFLSTTGVMCQAIGLWFALKAVGLTVSIFVPIIAFPIAGLASALPLPGGAGGIEAALITIVIAFSSSMVADVSAAVIIIRSFIYWIPVVIGVTNLALVSLRKS